METLKQLIKTPIFWISAVILGVGVYLIRKNKRGFRR